MHEARTLIKSAAEQSLLLSNEFSYRIWIVGLVAQPGLFEFMQVVGGQRHDV